MFNINFIDIIVIILLILGLVVGFKRGFIKSIWGILSTIIIIVVAFMFKDPLAELMYTHLPFFSFSGKIAGVAVLNIFVYEIIAFLIIVILASVALRIISVVTGIIGKLALGSPGVASRIFGMILGFVEIYLIVFALLLITSFIPRVSNYVYSGAISAPILEKTPILSSGVKNNVSSIREIMELSDTCKSNITECNLKAFDVMLKYKIVKPNTAAKLVNEGKIKIDGAAELVEKYGGKVNG